MHIRIDEIKKIKYFLFFRSERASSPNILLILKFSLSAVGGVLGKVKLKIPKIKDAAAVRKKVFSKICCDSHPRNPIVRPATIHPTVPKTLMGGNSFEGSTICLNATELTKANVGMYRIM